MWCGCFSLPRSHEYTAGTEGGHTDKEHRDEAPSDILKDTCENKRLRCFGFGEGCLGRHLATPCVF